MSNRRPLSELLIGLLSVNSSGKYWISRMATWANEHKNVLKDEERELFERKCTSKEQYVRSIGPSLRRLFCDLSQQEQTKHDVRYWFDDGSTKYLIDSISKFAFEGNGIPISCGSQAKPEQLNKEEGGQTTLKPPAQPADDAPIREFVGWLHRLVSFTMELQ